MSFIILHRFEGLLYMFLREFATYKFLIEVILDSTFEILGFWIAFDPLPDLRGFFYFWFLAISWDKLFICLSNLTILIKRISFTVLVPNRAALDALDIWEILAAFCPPPVKYCEIQIKSKAMVRVETRSSQK